MIGVHKLYDVLPAEKRITQTMKVHECLKKALIVHEVTFAKAGDTDYATMLVSVAGVPNRVKVTVNQDQIVSALKYVDQQKAFPVAAMLIPVGKSYALVDPPEEPQPEPQPEKKEG